MYAALAILASMGRLLVIGTSILLACPSCCLFIEYCMAY